MDEDVGEDDGNLWPWVGNGADLFLVQVVGCIVHAHKLGLGAIKLIDPTAHFTRAHHIVILATHHTQLRRQRWQIGWALVVLVQLAICPEGIEEPCIQTLLLLNPTGLEEAHDCTQRRA